MPAGSLYPPSSPGSSSTTPFLVKVQPGGSQPQGSSPTYGGTAEPLQAPGHAYAVAVSTSREHQVLLSPFSMPHSNQSRGSAGRSSLSTRATRCSVPSSTSTSHSRALEASLSRRTSL